MIVTQLSGRVAATAFLREIYRPASDVSIAEVADGAVLLNPHNGNYFGLDTTALFIFRQFDGARNCDAIVDAVIDSFEVDRATAAADLEKLARDLEANGLIVAANGAATGV